MPSSPKGWVRYAARVLESKSSVHSGGFDYHPPEDPRMRGDSFETAISVKTMLERSRNGCKGRGPHLLVRAYLGSEPWEAFTDRQKHLIRKTERKFRRQLIDAGFLDPPAPR